MVSSAASSLVTPDTNNRVVATEHNTQDYPDRRQVYMSSTVETEEVDSHNDVLSHSKRSVVGKSR